MQFRCHPELVKTRNLATDQIFAQVNIKIQHAMSLHLSLFERLWNVFQDGFLRCQLSLRPLDGHQDDTELVRQFWIRVSSFQACVVVSKHGYAVKTTSFKSCGDWCHPSAKIKVSPLSYGVWAVCQCGFSWVMKLERLAAWMFDSTCGFYRSSKRIVVTGKSKMHSLEGHTSPSDLRHAWHGKLWNYHFMGGAQWLHKNKYQVTSSIFSGLMSLQHALLPSSNILRCTRQSF